MHTLVWTSPKGGVGKTTLALNSAYALARRGLHVLVVDTDPQGAIGLSLSREVLDRPGFRDFVWHQGDLDELLLSTRMPNFKLLPVGQLPALDVPRYEQLLTSGLHVERLQREARQRGVDLLIFDTPCGFGGATIGALRMADGALSPLQAEPIASRAAHQLFEVLGGLRQQGSSVRLLGFVLTMLQHRARSSWAIAQDIWESFPPEFLLRTVIPRHEAFLDATSAGMPLAMMPDVPLQLASAFEGLASEIQDRLHEHQEEPDDGPTSFLV